MCAHQKMRIAEAKTALKAHTVLLFVWLLRAYGRTLCFPGYPSQPFANKNWLTPSLHQSVIQKTRYRLTIVLFTLRTCHPGWLTALTPKAKPDITAIFFQCPVSLLLMQSMWFLCSLLCRLLCNLCGHHRSAAWEQQLFLTTTLCCIFICGNNWGNVCHFEICAFQDKEDWQPFWITTFIVVPKPVRMVAHYRVSLGSVYNKRLASSVYCTVYKHVQMWLLGWKETKLVCTASSEHPLRRVCNTVQLHLFLKRNL